MAKAFAKIETAAIKSGLIHLAESLEGK